MSQKGNDEFMRNKRRNDGYVSQRINNIINSIPNNPFIGFSNTIKPIDKIDQNIDDWYESEFTTNENPYKP